MTLTAILKGRDSSALIAILSKLSAAGFAFLSSLLVARTLGAEGAGIYGLGLTLLSICGVIGGLGLDISSLQILSRWYGRKRFCLVVQWLQRATAICVIGPALAAAIVIAFLFMVPSEQYPLGIISIAAIGSIPVVIARLFSSALRSIQAPLVANICDPFLVPFLFTVFYAVAPTKTPFTAISIYVAVAVIAVCASGLVLSVRLPSPVNRRHRHITMSGILQRTAPLFGSQVAGFLANWLPIIALGLLATPRDVGIYRTVTQIVLIVAFVQQAAEINSVPKMSSLVSSESFASLAKFAQRQLMLVIAVVILPILCLFIKPEQILSFFGPEFEEGATLLVILLVGLLPTMMLGPMGSVLLALKRQGTLFKSAALALCVLAITGLPLIVIAGSTGAAIAVALSTTVRAVVNAVVLWKKFGIFIPLGRAQALHGISGRD
jgi:O-antigen/teichoic acid export membrane protein